MLVGDIRTLATRPLCILQANMNQPLTDEQASFPDEFPADWACDWGEDRYGLWMSFRLRGVLQQMRWILPGEFTMGSRKPKLSEEMTKLNIK